MNKQQYHEYVLAECKRQWHENQEEIYGPWEEQTEEERKDYYNQMYNDLADNLFECPLGGDETNDCADCAYAGDYHFVNGECVARED